MTTEIDSETTCWQPGSTNQIGIKVCSPVKRSADNDCQLDLHGSSEDSGNRQDDINDRQWTIYIEQW